MLSMLILALVAFKLGSCSSGGLGSECLGVEKLTLMTLQKMPIVFWVDKGYPSSVYIIASDIQFDVFYCGLNYIKFYLIVDLLQVIIMCMLNIVINISIISNFY